MKRQGKGFLDREDPGPKELGIPESATGTALHEDRVLVRRDVRLKGLRHDDAEPGTGVVVRMLERRRTWPVRGGVTEKESLTELAISLSSHS